MDGTRLTILLTEAQATMHELWDIQGPVTLSPGAVHDLARAMSDLIDTCQQLHTHNLALRVQAAARHEPPGDVL